MADFTGPFFGERGFGGGREPGRRGLPDNGRPATPSSSPATSPAPSPPPQPAAATTTTTAAATAPPSAPAAASALPHPPTTAQPPPPTPCRRGAASPVPPPPPPPLRFGLRSASGSLRLPSAGPLDLAHRPSQSPGPDGAPTAGPLPRPNNKGDDKKYQDLNPLVIGPTTFDKVKENNMKLNRVVLHGGLRPNDIITYHNGIRLFRIRVTRIFTGSRILLQVYDPSNNGQLRGLMRDSANGEFRNPSEIVDALTRDFGTTFNNTTNRDATPWNALVVYRAGRRIGTLNEVRENIRQIGLRGVQQGGASNTTRGQQGGASNTTGGDAGTAGRATETTGDAAGTAGGATENAEQATEPTGRATETAGGATEHTGEATEPTAQATTPPTPARAPAITRPINEDALGMQPEAMRQTLGHAPGERREREDEDEDEPEPPKKRARYDGHGHGFH